MAATTGLGPVSREFRNRADVRATGLMTSFSLTDLIWVMSAPAMKFRPLPVITRALTSSSSKPLLMASQKFQGKFRG